MAPTLTPARQQFRATLATLAAKTKTKLPALNGRVEKACTLVLAGDVELHADGTALVASLSQPTRAYQITQGVCQCRDWGQAPEHLCCHRLAAGFLRKAEAVLAQSTDVETAPAQPAPTRERSGMRLETQVVIEGRPVKVAVWGPDDADVQARLQAVLAQYPTLASPPASTQGQGDTPQCTAHGAMRQGKRGWFCPRKLDDDTWCKSKGR